MCWLPIDQPLLRPGDSTCSGRRLSPCSAAQLLASRLRRIGDHLEKSWTAGAGAGAGEGDGEVGLGCGGAGASVAVGARGNFKGFLRMAVRLTALVLFVAKRHL